MSSIYTQRNAACRIGRRPTFRLVYPFPFLDGPPPPQAIEIRCHQLQRLSSLTVSSSSLSPIDSDTPNPTHPNLQLIFHCWFGLILSFLFFHLIRNTKKKKNTKQNGVKPVRICASYSSGVRRGIRGK